MDFPCSASKYMGLHYGPRSYLYLSRPDSGSLGEISLHKAHGAYTISTVSDKSSIPSL